MQAWGKLAFFSVRRKRCNIFYLQSDHWQHFSRNGSSTLTLIRHSHSGSGIIFFQNKWFKFVCVDLHYPVASACCIHVCTVYIPRLHACVQCRLYMQCAQVLNRTFTCTFLPSGRCTSYKEKHECLSVMLFSSSFLSCTLELLHAHTLLYIHTMYNLHYRTVPITYGRVRHPGCCILLATNSCNVTARSMYNVALGCPFRENY